MMFAAMANGVMSAKAGEPWIPLCCYDRKPPQLAFAHAVTTKAKARYFCFQNAMGSGVSDLAILDRTWLAQCSDLNNNPRIVKLRGEYLSLVGPVIDSAAIL
jgi:hypothetical protein